MKLFLLAASLLLICACGKVSESASVELNTPAPTAKQEPLPAEIKRQILEDLQNGGRLNSYVVSGGTGQFASNNGGALTTINSRGDTMHTYTLKAEWVNDTKAWLKEIGQ